MSKKPNLKLVSNAPTLGGPPRKLGLHGTALWTSVTREYGIEDAGGVELLTLACQALDRAESLREQIDREGEVIRTKSGLRDHPGLKHELQNRAFVTRCIARLGLDVESLKPIGRPGTAEGWMGPEQYNSRI